MFNLSRCKRIICGFVAGVSVLVTPSIADEPKSLPEFAVMALDHYPETFDAPSLRITPIYRIDGQMPVYNYDKILAEVVPYIDNWSLREQLITDDLLVSDERSDCCSDIRCEDFLYEDACGMDICCLEEECCCCCCCYEELTGLAGGGGGGGFGGAAFGFGYGGGGGGGGKGKGKDHKKKKRKPKVKIPEPSTWLLLGGMLVVVACLKRRKSLI